MTRCPITYDKIDSGRYSSTGLHYLNPALNELHLFPLPRNEQLLISDGLISKISIPGSGPKINAQLSVTQQQFTVSDRHGSYLLKPDLNEQDERVQNEDLTMRLAKTCGIDVPLHCLIHAVDDSMLFVIRRFDRTGRSGKVHVEDFAQISGRTRQSKKNASLEEVGEIIDTYCTFPVVEKLKLFRRVLFSYLVGNGDMHLKNLSIIHRDDKIQLSPAYDLLNTTIGVHQAERETALSLSGRYSDFTRDDFVSTFAQSSLGLHEKAVSSVVETIRTSLPEWRRLIKISFLSNQKQQDYINVLDQRLQRLA